MSDNYNNGGGGGGAGGYYQGPPQGQGQGRGRGGPYPYRGGGGGGPRGGYGQQQQQPPYMAQPPPPQQQPYPSPQGHPHHLQQMSSPNPPYQPQPGAYAPGPYGGRGGGGGSPPPGGSQPYYPPPQQYQQGGGYAPRGGYQGGGGYQDGSGYAPRGGYRDGGGYAPRGGYQDGSGYVPRGGYRGDYVPRGGYRGGAGGGPYRGGYQQQRPPYGGNTSYRGRGGQYGRGRGGFRNGPQDDFFLVQLESFSKLEEVGRKGTLEGVVAPQLLFEMSHRSRGNVQRILIVIEKKYLAALISVPRSPDDIFLSPGTATTFMDIQCALNDDGAAIVNEPSGSRVARHLFFQLRSYLSQLVPYDKPAAEIPDLDVYAKPTEELLSVLAENKNMYTALSAAFEQDTEASTELFNTLVNPPLPGDAASADGATHDGEEQEHEQEQDGGEGEAGAQAKKGKRKTLFTSPQGLQLLKLGLRQATKRAAFFNLLEGVSDSGAGTGGEFVFRSFFNGILTSDVVFESFGLKALGRSEKPAKSDREIEIICKGFSRFGIIVLCGNGGTCTLTGLVNGLRPGFRSYDTSRKSKAPAAGGKRGRDEQTEDTKETVDKAVAAKVPASLQEYKPSAAPSDWNMFYAIADTFTTGELWQPRPQAGSSTAAESAAAPTPSVAEDATALANRRIEILTHHIVACRAVQLLIPHFAEAVLSLEVEGEKGEDGAQKKYQQQSKVFLMETAKRFKDLMAHSHGNYVAQSLLSELAPRAIPGTYIETILNAITDIVVDNIFEVSVQKCSSNCVECALSCTQSNPAEGFQFLFRVARALMENGAERCMTVAANQFGNYVVRHVCVMLTNLATGKTPDAGAKECEEARELEKKLFLLLKPHLPQLNQTKFGFGLLQWHEAQSERLGGRA